MNQPAQKVVIGIDLGTQGVRVLGVSPIGEVAAAAHAALPGALPGLPEGWFEQSPQAWWESTKACLQSLLAQLQPGVIVSGISVDSTSGTILPVDARGEPLYPAIMYNDRRSEQQALAVIQAAAEHQAAHGYVFGSSFGLPKIVWLQQQRPEIFQNASQFIHAADYITGKLSGSFTISDSSNSLKTGVNLHTLTWPSFIEEKLGIPNERLPGVVLPGTVIGQVCPQAALETGLRVGIPIVAGATDGTAAQIASGAGEPGDWNSTLGTTLVLKGISPQLVIDPQGRFYSHRHPEGWWMPGGASNTGGEWISLEHPQANLQELDRQAERCAPTRVVRYPLVKRGERFPFNDKTAQGFTLGESRDWIEHYTAGLEGVAFLERLAYEVVEQMGMCVGTKIYITGGGSRSPLWNRIRASVLGRQMARPAVAETAMGAAVLAAAGCWYPSLHAAVDQMVQTTETIEPDLAWQTQYEAQYQKFKAELARRGYLA